MQQILLIPSNHTTREGKIKALKITSSIMKLHSRKAVK